MAADPTYKISFLFGDPFQTLGWIENMYLTAASPDQGMTQATNVAFARASWLAAGLSIGFIRLSGNTPQLGVNPRRQRAAFLSRVDIQGSFGASSTPDTAWQAAKLRYADNTGFIFRTQLSRGLPDSFWDLGNDKIAQAQFKILLPPYLAALIANNVVIMHKNPGPPPSLNPLPVARIQYEGLTRRATGRPLLLPRGRRAA